MNVTELQGQRFELALERLAEGHAFTYKDVSFRIDADGTLECAVPSSWAISNVTAASANLDLDRAERVLAELTEHPEISDLVSRGGVRLVLFHDYGSGAIGLCTRTEAGLVWMSGAPRS